MLHFIIASTARVLSGASLFNFLVMMFWRNPISPCRMNLELLRESLRENAENF